MESLDGDFFEMFYNVLKNHLTDSFSNESVKSIRRLLPEVRQKFKAGKAKKSFVRSYPSQASVSKFQNSAYFYECSMCLTSSVARTLLELTEKNLDFFSRKMSRKTVNICCIAGVLGSEAVAVVKVLVNKIGNEAKYYTNFNLTFVNADDKWESVTSAVLQELKEHIGGRYRAKVTRRFVVEDPKKMGHGVLEAFQSADVLLATKLSQELCNIPDKDFKHLLLTAFDHMKADSLLLFADFSSADFINVLDKETLKLDSLQSIYKETCVFHSLSTDAVSRHLACYTEHFGRDMNSSYCNLSAAAWLKSDRKFARNGEGSAAATSVPKRKLEKSRRASRRDFCSFSKTVESMCGKGESVPVQKSEESEEAKSAPKDDAAENWNDENENVSENASAENENDKAEHKRSTPVVSSSIGKKSVKKSVVTRVPNYEHVEHERNSPVNHISQKTVKSSAATWVSDYDPVVHEKSDPVNSGATNSVKRNAVVSDYEPVEHERSHPMKNIGKKSAKRAVVASIPKCESAENVTKNSPPNKPIKKKCGKKKVKRKKR